MARSREALIEKLSAITDRKALAEAISALTEDFETDHIIYHSVSYAGEEFATATYSDHRRCARSFEGLGFATCDCHRTARPKGGPFRILGYPHVARRRDR